MGETAISKAIADAIKALGFKVLRLHSGGVKVRGGYMAGNETGTPDRCVLLSGGTVVFLEVKRPGEKQRAEQVKWADDAAKWGHVVHVVDNTQDAIRLVLEAQRAAKRRAA